MNIAGIVVVMASFGLSYAGANLAVYRGWVTQRWYAPLAAALFLLPVAIYLLIAGIQ